MSDFTEAEETVMKGLHKLLLETEVIEGRMICGNCGHEYRIKEGIANFLLPSHLGRLIFGPGNLSIPIQLTQARHKCEVHL